jgi:hypothetical protein
VIEEVFMQHRCPECGMVGEHANWCPAAGSFEPDGTPPDRTDKAQNGRPRCPACGELRLDKPTVTLDRQTGKKPDRSGLVFGLVVLVPAVVLLFLIIMTWNEPGLSPAKSLGLVAALLAGALYGIFSYLGIDRVNGWVCTGCGNATVVEDPLPTTS